MFIIEGKGSDDGMYDLENNCCCGEKSEKYIMRYFQSELIGE